ncbi:hypothetical protein GQ44DRAFT_724665 [Phaeosphaeriaceae sp. PMI808]|nr:hypothetical protein GQ44DRAFT_724665 [Phaeosphaeriaceae sp. PMI808]
MVTPTSTGTKRKATTEVFFGGCRAQVTKKAKFSKGNIPPVLHQPTVHTDNAEIATDSSNDSQSYQVYSEDGGRQDPKNSVIRPAQCIAKGVFHEGISATARMAKRVARERLNEDQVSFIILTRDNYVPVPNGEHSHSRTCGKTIWDEVTRLYNKKYGLSVVMQTTQKRYKDHIKAWLAKHPEHPPEIVYTKELNSKDPISLVKEAMQINRVKQTDQRDKGNEDGDDVHGGYTGMNKADDAHDTGHDFAKSELVLTSLRVGGWVPPDIIRNQADINNYMYKDDWAIEEEAASEDEATDDEDTDIEETETDSDSEDSGSEDFDSETEVDQDENVGIQPTDMDVNDMAVEDTDAEHINIQVAVDPPMVKVEVEDTNDQVPDLPDALLETICTSSDRIHRELLEYKSINIKLMCDSNEVISLYFQCIFSKDDNDVLEGDSSTLFNLYAIATQMEDDYVRGLVMEEWRAIANRDIELALDPADLNLLYESTDIEDPAREFWTTEICANSLGDQIVNSNGYPKDFASGIQETMRIADSPSI